MNNWRGDSTEQREAAAETLRSFQAATDDRRRARIWAEPEGEPRVDVTEHVVSLLDMIATSINWGSDFWTDDDLPSFITLCSLLKFEEIPAAPPPQDEYWHGTCEGWAHNDGTFQWELHDLRGQVRAWIPDGSIAATLEHPSLQDFITRRFGVPFPLLET